MANWFNVQLAVFGAPRALRSFSTAAGAKVGRINTDHSVVFLPSMEMGEGGDLFTERAKAAAAGVTLKRYYWQSRTGEELDHFGTIARRYPDLAFVLVAEGEMEAQSWLLKNRGRREWTTPPELCEALRAQALKEYGIEDPDDPDAQDDLYHADFNALFKMMDAAVAHWTPAAIASVRRASQRRPDKRPAPPGRRPAGRNRR